MAWSDLTEEEREAVILYLRRYLAAERYPMAPALRPLKRAIDKLDPPAASSTPYPAPKPSREPSLVHHKLKGGKRRR